MREPEITTERLRQIVADDAEFSEFRAVATELLLARRVVEAAQRMEDDPDSEGFSMLITALDALRSDHE